nr:hypothetical protein [Marinicella sp. W31]MDC2877447.1 hypothetical protein [Marinicella sp. W31]
MDAYPEVLRALGTTVLYDYDPAFQAFFEDLTLKAQEALGCDLPPLILQGSRYSHLRAPPPRSSPETTWSSTSLPAFMARASATGPHAMPKSRGNRGAL